MMLRRHRMDVMGKDRKDKKDRMDRTDRTDSNDSNENDENDSNTEYSPEKITISSDVYASFAIKD